MSEEKKEEKKETKKEVKKEVKKEGKKPAKKEKAAPVKKEFPELKPGYTIRVHQLIKEGNKERVQVFEGMILAMKGKTPETKTMTVYKVSQNIGVEKIFPLALPTITKIEVVKKARVRRSKLYYLKSYKKRIQEEKVN